MKPSWKTLYINAYLCNLEKWYCCCSVAKSCNPMACSIPGFPVFHCLLEFPQVHVHWVGDAIQPSHPLLPSSLFAFSLSWHQGLFQWVGYSHQVAKVLDIIVKYMWASLVAQKVKPLPAMWETWVWSLGQEDPLEKEMATCSSTLAWKISWATIRGVAKSWTRLSDFT